MYKNDFFSEEVNEQRKKAISLDSWRRFSGSENSGESTNIFHREEIAEFEDKEKEVSDFSKTNEKKIKEYCDQIENLKYERDSIAIELEKANAKIEEYNDSNNGLRKNFGTQVTFLNIDSKHRNIILIFLIAFLIKSFFMPRKMVEKNDFSSENK